MIPLANLPPGASWSFGSANQGSPQIPHFPPWLIWYWKSQIFQFYFPSLWNLKSYWKTSTESFIILIISRIIKSISPHGSSWRRFNQSSMAICLLWIIFWEKVSKNVPFQNFISTVKGFSDFRTIYFRAFLDFQI